MDLKPTERSILLGLLMVGDALPVTIAEAGGVHARSVSRSMPNLVELGFVVEKDRSVYALTPRGYAEARRVLRETSRTIQRDRGRDTEESAG